MIKFKLSIKRSKFSPRAFLAGGMIWGMMVLSVLGQGITSSWEETEDAVQIIETIRSRVPTEEIMSKGILKLKISGEKTRYIPIQFGVRPLTELSWESSYETLVQEGVQERLVIVNHVTEPSQCFLSTRNAGEKEWKTRELLPGRDTAIRFADTDFWVCDLELEFLQWKEQSFIKREMRKGRSCRVIESSMPRDLIRGNMYRRVLSWVDNESGGIVMAQSYNPQGKRVKEFEVQSFKKVKGTWQLKQMTIYDNQRGSRTTLEIDLSVEDPNETGSVKEIGK